MKKIFQEIIIKNSPENVWDAVVNLSNYKKWASTFHEDTFFEGGWNKGDSILFLMINKEGQREGMVSEIAESRFPSFISIKHLGYVSNDLEDYTADKNWQPAFENYTLEKISESSTLFKVEMDILDEYYDLLVDFWAKALIKLKEVCE